MNQRNEKSRYLLTLDICAPKESFDQQLEDLNKVLERENREEEEIANENKTLSWKKYLIRSISRVR